MCDIRTYTGGFLACQHGWSLLDADQEIPWQDQPLRYWQKYRFYFQEVSPPACEQSRPFSLTRRCVPQYKPDFHIITEPRQGWGIAAAGGHAEYDVPRCPDDTPVEDCKHEIWGVLTPGGDDLHLAAIHFQ